MTTRKSITAFISMASIMIGLTACQKKEEATGQGPAQKVGEQIDQATAKASEELNKAGEKAGELMQRAGEKGGEAVQKAGEKLESTSKNAQSSKDSQTPQGSKKQ